jgi:aminoglycoside phosphotransferase (APT) family kinase protein
VTGPDTPIFGADSTRLALDAACERVGFSREGARLLRLGENALYLLARPPVVVRIARTMDFWDDAVKEVEVSRWLARHGFPAARVCDVPQPVEARGRPVTFWRYVAGRTGSRGDVSSLGRLLRRLHAVPPPAGFRLPPARILDRVEGRIELAPVPAEDKDFLLGRCEQLKGELSRLAFPLPPAVTHGDAHVNNIIIGGGRPVLIDFERFAWGQPEWDLAVTATEHRTAGWWTDAEYRAFVDAYGYDVTRWDGFDVLRRTNEIKMTTWIMQDFRESAAKAAEYGRRLRTIRTGAAGDWQPF